MAGTSLLCDVKDCCSRLGLAGVEVDVDAAAAGLKTPDSSALLRAERVVEASDSRRLIFLETLALPAFWGLWVGESTDLGVCNNTCKCHSSDAHEENVIANHAYCNSWTTLHEHLLQPLPPNTVVLLSLR